MTSSLGSRFPDFRRNIMHSSLTTRVASCIQKKGGLQSLSVLLSFYPSLISYTNSFFDVGGYYCTWSQSATHTTLGMTPLDEGSARRRDLYLTTYNIHKRPSVSPAGFESAIQASERPQTHALEARPPGSASSETYYGENFNIGNGARLSCCKTQVSSCLKTTSITSKLEMEKLSI